MAVGIQARFPAPPLDVRGDTEHRIEAVGRLAVATENHFPVLPGIADLLHDVLDGGLAVQPE